MIWECFGFWYSRLSQSIVFCCLVAELPTEVPEMGGKLSYTARWFEFLYRDISFCSSSSTEAEDNVDTSINENSGGVATTTSTTSSSTMRPLQPKRMEPLPQTVRASQPPPIIINPKLPVVSLVTASPINEPTASASWVVDPPVLSRSTTFSNNPLIVESSCVSHTDRFTMGGGDKSRTPSFSSGPKVPPNASTVISVGFLGITLSAGYIQHGRLRDFGSAKKQI